MRNSVFIPIFFITILAICCVSVVPIKGQCLEDQRNLLLQLKNTLKFNSSFSTKLVQWNQNTDCCLWEGVICSKSGHITALDLSSESISGGINNSTSLFGLNFLQSLNLANNSFSYAQIPSAFINLANLTYLNLSCSDFGGQIPIELSRMTRLVTLDLSTLFPEIRSLKLENPNLTSLVQNLTALTQLNLDGVNISAEGHDWCRAVSSSLPKLRLLSLSNCQLSGPIDSSLLKLHFLSVIRLHMNNLNSPVPEFLANFKNLTALHLSSCNLKGEFPEKIFKVQTLQTLDLSSNELLKGSLPEFPPNGSLQSLLLSDTNFSGALPNSIGNLGMLSKMDLARSNFSGPIPNSIENLTQLIRVDLSSNMFTGPMPLFRGSKNIAHVVLSRNNFSGSISSNQFKGLVKLVSLDLRFNSFSGRIPSSLFALPSLKNIELSNNQFDGPLAEIPNTSSSQLNMLDLRSNKLEGEIPSSFFDLKRLNVLSLSSNNLNGTVKLENVQKLVSLTSLDLSYNNLSFEISGNNSNWYASPQIRTLKLASCKLRNFPDLKTQSKLYYLDLSSNQIGGEIPNWIWTVGAQSLSYLNLSHNLFENLQYPYSIPTLNALDLHNNYLRGELPIPPESTTYVDYSSNYFSSSIPTDIGNKLTFAYFFSAANNNLTGTIPESICNATYLQVLDLSNNNLSGAIPLCLIEWRWSLGVLNLGKNLLTGNISGTFQGNCGLQTLDLHDNYLQGKIPKSLANCTSLEVLNLGNNRILDTFPSFLNNSTNLRVLVLRSNLFHGGIQCSGVNKSWPNLQIIDIASNNFFGALIPKCFLNWKAMMDDASDPKPELNHLYFKFLQLNNFYYQDTVTVTNKGQQMELVKILTIFTSIDFSNNNFEGEIPETIGELKSLYVLNLSHNAFTGSIPPSFGNLKELGSLDLSANKLIGKIPPELASITFLSFLNLSYNQLAGKIPSGNQFQTFAETSFEGNDGLCGPPLNKSCSDAKIVTTFKDKHLRPKGGMKWEFLSAAGVGYTVGLGFVIGPLFFCKRWSEWYWKCVDRVSSLIVNEKYKGRIKGYKKPIRRL